MNLVLETGTLPDALREKRDWERMGHPVRLTEKRKVWKGGWQKVYRVWVGKKRRSTG